MPEGNFDLEDNEEEAGGGSVAMKLLNKRKEAGDTVV